MPGSDILKEDVADFVLRLEPMTDDEAFAVMKELEDRSEAEQGDADKILSRIALVEEQLNRRFPGQLLAPYLTWKKRRSTI